MCLFVRVVDHGVNEGEPVYEQYYEQANEDQFRDPNPKDSTSSRTFRKALKTASSIPSFDAYFVLVFKNTTYWPVSKLHVVLLLKHGWIATP